MIGSGAMLRRGIKLALRFVPKVHANKVRLYDSLSQFLKELPAEARLTRWGGCVAFDLDTYACCEAVKLNVCLSEPPLYDSSLNKVTFQDLLRKIQVSRE